jgi:hypothetical protein
MKRIRVAFPAAAFFVLALAPRPHAFWIPGHWRHTRRGWYWIGGRWR